MKPYSNEVVMQLVKSRSFFLRSRASKRSLISRSICFRFFVAWRCSDVRDLRLECVAHPHEFCLRIGVVWLILELARTSPVQIKNMRAARVVFMSNQAKRVNDSGGNLWNSLAPLRRGSGSKQPFDVPTPALLDKDGATLDTMPAIKDRWVWHFSEVVGGVPTTAAGIVDRIIFAEQSRSDVSYDGDFTCLPTLDGIRKDIAGT